jgi:hypothetical protein
LKPPKLALSIIALSSTFVFALVFQNCNRVDFAAGTAPATDSASSTPISIGTPAAPCTEGDCGLTPLVSHPGVVTILLALGDKVNDSLVVNGGAARFIAETSVRYSSPLSDPKILVVRDLNNHGESAYDPQYIAQVLLARYRTNFQDEPVGGLTAADLAGYDLIWFNNPGYPMGSIKSRDALLAFKGGVVLSGDDMSQGSNFDMSALTGLKFIDNGSTVNCSGKTFNQDNNVGGQYKVTIDESKIPGAQGASLNLLYGNDIDNTIASNTVEVIASAVGGDASCTQTRPTIVRYPKP